MLCIAYCTYYGVYYWFGGEAASVEDRMYGPTEGAIVIGRVGSVLFCFFLVRLGIGSGSVRSWDGLVWFCL